MEEFAKNIERAGVSCAVNSIGFSEGHDADLLTRLSKSGTR